MTVEVITITKPELDAIIERTAKAAAAELRREVAASAHMELMTKAELAKYLRCDVSKINRYMGKGLPAEQFGGQPRFRKVDIDNWLKHGRQVKGEVMEAEGVQ